jgi:sugar lactone lactonase YvrE
MLNHRLFAVCGAVVLSAALVLIATASAANTPATAVHLHAPEDVTFDALGNVYISEFGTSKTAGHTVDEVDLAGNLRVVAGTGIEGYGGDGGPATRAQLDSPTGLLIDTTGALVVADHHNGCMRRIDASGVINAIVGYCGRVGYNGDGKFPALKTKFDDPMGIVEDSTGTMFVADEQNARVRRVTPDGVVSTILGGGKIPLPDAPDGTLGTNIKMLHPSYLALDAGGNLYVSDFEWNQVVRIDPQGRVTHIAGTGVAGFGGDSGPATSALLDFPTGLALDPRGRLYISDSFNNRIRMVDSRGRISTVAGSGPTGYLAGSYSGDGGPATDATLNAPSGIALSADGRLFIADQGNNVVRVLQPGGTIELFAGTPQSG